MVKPTSDKWEEIAQVVFPCGMFRTKDGEDTAQKNIYDIAGNVWEFTTERKNSVDPGEIFKRGGDAGVMSGMGATVREGNYMDWWTDGDWAIGFRIVLYVKK